MSDGKPITAFEFSQDPENPEQDAQPSVAQGTPEGQEDRRESKLLNALHSSGHWAEEPHISDQEARFPSSVRTHSVTFILLNVVSPQDMAEYSKIYMSDSKRGRYVFAGHEVVQWDLPNSRCFILIRVEERRFLALTTSNSNPNED